VSSPVFGATIFSQLDKSNSSQENASFGRFLPATPLQWTGAPTTPYATFASTPYSVKVRVRDTNSGFNTNSQISFDTSAQCYYAPFTQDAINQINNNPQSFHDIELPIISVNANSNQYNCLADGLFTVYIYGMSQTGEVATNSNQTQIYFEFSDDGTFSSGGSSQNEISNNIIIGSGVDNLTPSDPTGSNPTGYTVNGSVDAQIHPYDYDDDDEYYLEVVVTDNNYVDILVDDPDYFETEIEITDQEQTTYTWSNTFSEDGIQKYTVRLKKQRWYWLDQTIATKTTTFTLNANSEADDYFFGSGGDRGAYQRGVIPEDDLTTCTSPSGVVEEAVCNLRSITVEIMNWAFVPSEGTLASFSQVSDTMGQQFPFSYLYDITGLFDVTNFDDPQELEVILPMAETVLAQDITVFSLNEENEFLPSEVLSTFRFLMGTVVWFALVFYLYNRTRRAVDNLH
jgi:hypothetical protein